MALRRSTSVVAMTQVEDSVPVAGSTSEASPEPAAEPMPEPIPEPTQSTPEPAPSLQRSIGPQGRGRPPSRRRWFIEWGLILVAAVSVAVLVRATVVQAFYIPSPSMVPTLKVHDRLLVDKVTFHVRDVRRGDIVVFKRPPALQDKEINDLIKRVIGLPGDTVEGRDGHVFVNAKLLPERYLPKGLTTAAFDPVVVPLDAYFVMGDNRPESYDSRFWGTVDKSLIVGRAMFRIFPPTRIGRI